MAKQVIKIGSAYQAAFESISELVRGGCISSTIVTSADKDRIETPDNTFIFDSSFASIRTANTIGMTDGGATWFHVFRGGEVDSQIAAWHNLIESVAQDYHKKYSLFEFRHTSDKITPEEQQRHHQLIESLILTLWPDFPSFNVREGNRSEGEEDIYGISVCLSVSGGTGESVPVLAKIYFRRVADRLYPIAREEAAVINEHLNRIAEKNTSSGEVQRAPGDTDEMMIDQSIGALRRLIKNAGDFTNCLLIEDEEDCKTINAMVRNGPNDFVKLECTDIKPLGISHVRWQNACYKVMQGERPAFKVLVGINGNLTLSCINCGGETLVDGNRIVCTIEEDGTTRTQVITLDPTQDHMGLTQEDLDLIRQYSNISKHYLSMRCGETKRRMGRECNRLVCASQLVDFAHDPANPILKCADCPYPEVLYMDRAGTSTLTRTLKFAQDRMHGEPMIPVAETFVCKSCGESFSVDAKRRNNLCAICSTASDKLSTPTDRSTEEEKATYRRYATLLPLHTRLLTPNGRKFCYERTDMLLFVMDKKCYIVKKVDIPESGAIKAPARLEILEDRT